jgi:parallel beta-helix repeat protein
MNEDITIERCNIHKTGEHGIVVYPYAKRVTIRDCHILNSGLYTSEEYDFYYEKGVTDKKTGFSGGSNIKLNTVSDCIVEGCYLYGARYCGISIHTTKDAITGGAIPTENICIVNNIVEGNPSQARIGGGIIVEIANAVTISGNHVKYQRQVDGYTAHPLYPDIKYYSCKAVSCKAKCNVMNNIIENCDEGINICNGCVIGNIVVSKNNPISMLPSTIYDDYGVKIQGFTVDGCSVVGNRLFADGTYAYSHGISMKNASNVVIGENAIEGCKHGVYAQTSDNNNINRNININGNAFSNNERGMTLIKASNVIVSGNAIDGSKYGVYGQDVADNFNIYGNTFSNISNAENEIYWATVGIPTNSKLDFVAIEPKA